MKSQIDFPILKLSEEAKLSPEGRNEYYSNLRDYIKKRPYSNVTRGATTIAPKLKNITNKIASKITPMLAGGKVETIATGQENIPDGSVIFAHTHQGLLDNFSWIPLTPRHCIVLHSAKVKKLLVLIQLNTGLILVKKDKDASENRMGAKLDMIRLLLEGHSIVYYPESAWNLSPNKLHLDMSFGFLDIAKKAGVPVVPVVDEFTYEPNSKKERITKIHTHFGEPIKVGIGDDLREKLLEYEEQISTIRWQLIEEKGVEKRKELSTLYYKQYLDGNVKNLKMGGIDINVERALLWHADDEFYKFHHINDVPCDEAGNLLETEEVIRLRKIKKEHGMD